MGKKTAAILSMLIMGLGQFYAGHFWRALVWFFGSILALGALSVASGIGGLIVAPIIWIACAWDAYSIAK
jgi:TM2 domain-containing membrane protein YozV